MNTKYLHLKGAEEKTKWIIHLVEEAKVVLHREVMECLNYFWCHLMSCQLFFPWPADCFAHQFFEPVTLGPSLSSVPSLTSNGR